jgi:hypothetical protein
MGLSPAIFGNVAWRWLHLIAMTHSQTPTEEEKINILRFMDYQMRVLPCPACSYHATVYFRDHPLDTTSNATVVAWVNDFHNNVNRRLGRREFTLEESKLSTLEYFIRRDVNWKQLPVHEQNRREDHEKINKLTLQLVDKDTINKRTFNATISVVIAEIFVIGILVGAIIHLVRNTRNKKKNGPVRSDV